MNRSVPEVSREKMKSNGDGLTGVTTLGVKEIYCSSVGCSIRYSFPLSVRTKNGVETSLPMISLCAMNPALMPCLPSWDNGFDSFMPSVMNLSPSFGKMSEKWDKGTLYCTHPESD
jgi:hypothetical protein